MLPFFFLYLVINNIMAQKHSTTRSTEKRLVNSTPCTSIVITIIEMFSNWCGNCRQSDECHVTWKNCKYKQHKTRVVDCRAKTTLRRFIVFLEVLTGLRHVSAGLLKNLTDVKVLPSIVHNVQHIVKKPVK